MGGQIDSISAFARSKQKATCSAGVPVRCNRIHEIPVEQRAEHYQCDDSAHQRNRWKQLRPFMGGIPWLQWKGQHVWVVWMDFRCPEVAEFRERNSLPWWRWLRGSCWAGIAAGAQRTSSQEHLSRDPHWRCTSPSWEERPAAFKPPRGSWAEF